MANNNNPTNSSLMASEIIMQSKNVHHNHHHHSYNQNCDIDHHLQINNTQQPLSSSPQKGVVGESVTNTIIDNNRTPYEYGNCKFFPSIQCLGHL
ncbi:hypothetical protein BLA29_000708 [Euroglyphus maynei]|uniref:Uncharacterized protein n=1 Tax=Euroglyphus maynei TaxID=6958 RepID=A0A1Y3B7J9_EURMA|nr:hypothetical protein BLA29_000708 [Euroglyphus maynei]